MSTPTPPPRPALKATGVRRRDARCPEAELACLRAEVERLKKQIKDDNRSYGCELRDPNGTIWEQAAKDHARAERAEAELDALSKVKALLFDALEHYQNCVIAGGKNPARDGIAAAMKEGAIK